MKTIIKIFILTTIIFTLFFGCESIGRNSSMGKMSDQEIKQYFKEHKSDFEKIIKICEKNPSIRFMDDSIDGASFYSINGQYYNFSKQKKEVQNAVKETIQIIKKIKLYTVRCSRDGSTQTNKLSTISFSVYSSGLSIGGEGQSIFFQTLWAQHNPGKYFEKLIKDNTYQRLNKEGWFYTKHSK